ncbi:hypothetical protein N4T77_19990 [Clostridium sp. CX1]|uniref:hypothetical protein n=1 Tax=Clostridium sp. CX1 TaxID=2978346 RepID=UPI0021C0DF52|nr:hypothetical protein [Clostridium sp. CX1]MCT8978862.1 hypothetical protein [Clostridium sp. CX1]
MRVIYAYNPYDSKEVKIIARVKEELSSLVEDIQIVDFMDIREMYKIRETPALIILRDDLQGINLLTEDPDNNGQLRVTGEVYKAMQEEENNFHNMPTNRIDVLINTEVVKGQDNLMSDMIERGLL